MEKIDLLRKFAGYSESLSKPFKLKEGFASSDGHFVCYIKGFEYEGDFFQNNPYSEMVQSMVNKIVPIGKFIDLDALKKQIDELPNTKEYKTKECKECDGGGEVEYSYTDKNRTTHKKELDCPVCDGNGEIYSDKFELKKDKEALFKINNTAFNLNKFLEIIDLSNGKIEMMNIATEKEETELMWFGIGNNLFIGLMPCLTNGVNPSFSINVN